MNYAHLARKYFPASTVTVEDRTYNGLIWHGPGDKPLESIFQSLQDEEDRLVRVAGREVLSRESLMQEKQRQARDQAEKDLIPFQKKLGEWFEEERLKFKKLQEEVLELKSRLALKEHALDCWKEITEAQEEINKQAQTYLEETKHMLAWDTHRIPPEVISKREEAQNLLSDGKLVYTDWARLREAEMPSREDLRNAILKGGSELARMKKICNDVNLKYPKPRKNHF